jgi:hypothetical protein
VRRPGRGRYASGKNGYLAGLRKVDG